MLDTFVALGEANRLRIVELLLSGSQTVGSIGERLELNQPQVSKHLRVLKEARIVDVEVQAQRRLYSLRAEPLRELNAWLLRYRQIWDARFSQLDVLVAELQQNASRKSKVKDAKKQRKRN